MNRFSWAFLVFLCTNSLYANIIDLQSFEKYYYSCKGSRDFQIFYDSLSVIENELTENSDSEGLLGLNHLYNWVPKTSDDSVYFRRRLMYHGFKIKKASNNYLLSVPFYKQAADLWPKNKELDNSCLYIEKHLASSYARLNEYDKAIFYNSKTAQYLKRANRKNKLSRVYADIADLYMWLENNEMMLSYMNRGLEIALAENDFEALASHYLNYLDYCLNYSTESDSNSKFDQTYYNAERVINRLTFKQKLVQRKRDLYSFRANYYSKNLDFDSALFFFEKANLMFDDSKGQVSRERAKLNLAIANLYYDFSFLEEAEEVIDSAFICLLPKMKFNSVNELPLDSLYNENTFVDLFSLKAKIESQRFTDDQNIKHLDNAINLLDKAIKINFDLNRQLQLNNSKYISSIVNNSLINQAIEILHQAFVKSTNEKYIFLARTYFNLSKGQILNENIKKKLLYQKMEDNDKDLINEFELRLAQVQNKNISNVYLNRIEILLSDSILRIYEKYNSDLFSQYEFDGDYIEYFEGSKSYYVLSNLNQNAFIKIKKKEEISNDIIKLKSLIEQKSTIGLKELLNKLFLKLIPFDLSNSRDITIIPDGDLWFLQFDILTNNDKYLIENFIIKYASNFLFYKLDYSLSSELEALSIVPTYEKIKVDNLQLAERGGLSFLPFTKSESKYIQESFGANWQVDNTITLKSLKSKLSEVDIFHFAGHGVTIMDSSYLAFMNESNKVERLTDKTIAYLTNNIQLVVLSACQTGLGVKAKGEGILSLARSFLYSGSNSVVYTLWNSNDESSSQLMKNFYKELNLGQKKSCALRNAKLDFLDNCIPQKRHPFYWANLALIGDDVELKKNNSFNSFIYIFLILVVSIIYLKLKK